MLREKTVLAGWLFETARYAAANALKAQARRARREKRRIAMDTPLEHEDPRREGREEADWEKISPALDGALAALGAADRDAVLLRYMQGKSHQDVAGVLGISAEAARKRIDRALDKLRGYLMRGGVTLSAAGLGTLLATHSATAAPAGLSTSIVASLGAAGAAASAAAAAPPAIAKGTLAIFAWAKAHAVACGLAAVITTATSVVAVQKLAEAQSRGAAPALAQPIAQPAPAPGDGAPGAKEFDLEGVIQTPDGNPAAGAEVYVAMPESQEERTRMRLLQARIQAGQRPRPDEWNRRDHPPVEVYSAPWPQAAQATDRNGRFAYGGVREPWVLVARHSKGFIQVTHEEFKEARGQLVLEAWGRVEGRLMVGDKPQAGQKVHLFRSGSQHEWEAMQVRHFRQTTTDPDGNFIFEDVVPGDSWLAWEPTGKRLRRIRHTLVEVAAGKPTVQDIGGTGRPVIGRAALVPTNAPDVKLSWDMNARNQQASAMYSRFEGTRLGGFKPPPDFERMTPAQQMKLRRQWEKTPEGRKSLRYAWGEDFDINPDGTFRIDDLEPGQYNLQLRILRTENGFGEDLVECYPTITVPPLPEGVKRLDEPVDIGVIAVKLKERTEPGKPAPDFTATTIDGKRLKLADFKGRYVVLKWWWSWTEMDVEAPAMRKAHAAMEEDPKKEWVLINVAFDQQVETTKKRAADHQLPGIHCHVKGQDKFPRGYLGSPSTLCIIGPDGKVLRRNIQTYQAETEVAKINLEKQ
jgi:RNA polymerase sigma factor (sigma-70 family)